MSDDEYDWESCAGDTDIVSVVPRRRNSGPLLGAVQKCTQLVEGTNDTLARMEEDHQKMRILVAVMAVFNFLQLIPQTIKDTIVGFITTNGLRLGILMLLSHGIAIVLRRLQRKSHEPIVEGGSSSSTRPSVSIVEPTAALPPPPAPASNGELPDQVKKVLDLEMSPKWVLVKKENDITWEVQDVDWNGGHKITRFSGPVNCSLTQFTRTLIESAPKPQRQFDKMLDAYNVLEDYGSEGGRIVYVNFHSPVWGITRREVVSHIIRRLLTPEDCKKYNIEGQFPDLDASDRTNFEKQTLENPLVVGNISTTHPKSVESSSFTRAKINAQGYIVVPTSATTCHVTEIIALDVSGSLPAFAVEAGAKKVFARFNGMINYLNNLN
eukprot:TRINITY_DN2047_c0_g2_i1.p1 TRINITY_DN2047_c0_g2~~TRINITY_DN2047_c0_g2_i1.p1  ORF type:complete len:396 (+),score=75.48 TRINITY_DN2047_c0_g2_i1:47-1189(+)